MSSATSDQHRATEHNPLGVRAIDHLEFYVDDVEKWADFHEEKLGLYRRAHGDASTGLEGRRAIVSGQGRVTFLFAEAQGESEKAQQIRAFVDKHGCGVHDIAFRVDDVAHALREAEARGATVIRPLDDQEGFTAGSIAAYGDTIHTFIHRQNTRTFAPSYVDAAGGVEADDIHIMMIDHVVANVERMEEWVRFYDEVFGFEETAHFDINTGRSSLMSKVVGDTDGYIRLPINEPSSSNSQIQEFLDEFNGPGVQHIALLTSNIIRSVNTMRERGVDFLPVPDTYYDTLLDRVGEIHESVESLQSAKILVDRDRVDGYLLQLFTRPVFERPTLFYEIIQRHGNSVGFGEGNFQALFEAIEREQELRGSL